jgi:hypothetical protein
MLFTCYLRDGIVYVPTVARRKSEPIYTNIEPVAVVPVSSTEDVRRAFLEAIGRKNVVIPDRDAEALRAPPLLPKYAGVRSLSAFYRNASTWSIIEDDGVYKILSYLKHPKGYWRPDLAREIQFPVRTTVDGVIDRMIAILQEAARAEALGRRPKSENPISPAGDD